VKTFNGERKKYNITVDINDRIETLIRKPNPLTSIGKMDNTDELMHFHIIKFVYPMGKMRHLPLTDTFADLGIPEKACLVMIGKKEF
jgi:hypothetical protein